MTSPVKPSPEARVNAARAAATSKTTPKPADKPADGANKPGRKPGQKAKEYDFSALSLDVLASPAAVSETLAAKAAPTRTRDEKQMKMDAVVKQVHNDWVLKGKPAAWANMPKAAYAVDPKAVEALQYLINRAASFHGLAVRYGNPVRDSEGRQVVVFAIRDRRPRETKNGDDK